MAKFACWYNHEHYHSALKFVTPDQRHRGEDTDRLARRHALYQAAQLASQLYGLPQPRKAPSQRNHPAAVAV